MENLEKSNRITNASQNDDMYGSFIFSSSDNDGNDAGDFFTSLRDMEVIRTL
jgi:hypothetical protein